MKPSVKWWSWLQSSYYSLSAPADICSLVHTSFNLPVTAAVGKGTDNLEHMNTYGLKLNLSKTKCIQVEDNNWKQGKKQ